MYGLIDSHVQRLTMPPGFTAFPGTLNFLQIASQSATAFNQSGVPITVQPRGCVQGLDVNPLPPANYPYPYFENVTNTNNNLLVPTSSWTAQRMGYKTLRPRPNCFRAP